MSKEPATRLFRRGDFVYLTFAGRTVRAMVVVASANGRSLALMFEGIVGGYVAMMPVLREDDTFRDLINNAEVVITHQDEHEDVNA